MALPPPVMTVDELNGFLADAFPLKLGRRLSVTEVRLSSGDALVAQASVTYAIPG